MSAAIFDVEKARAVLNTSSLNSLFSATKVKSSKPHHQKNSFLLPTVDVRGATEADPLLTFPPIDGKDLVASPASSTVTTVSTTSEYATLTMPTTTTPKHVATREVLVQKRVIVSAVANLSTAYNLAVVNYALMMLRETYPIAGPRMTSLVVSCSLAGAILGQIGFGYIGDTFGRRKGMIVTLVLTIVGAMGSAICPWGARSCFYVLAAFRFLLGLGVGGTYPLSATTAVEASRNDIVNSKAVATVFSFQGCGQLLAPFVAFVLLSTSLSHSVSWRLLFMVGALPGLFVLKHAYESKESHPKKSSVDQLSLADALMNDKIRDRLIGASLGWFLFDITFYGNVIFTPIILEDLFAYDSSHLPDVAFYSLLVAAVALPGYYVTIYMVGKVNFKMIQMQGFLAMAMLFFIIGFNYDQLLAHKNLLLTLYALTFFFSNFGPNVSTFSLPAEIFPIEGRVKLNGIAAAWGKIGATVGAALYGVIEKELGVSYVLVLSGIVSVLGALATHFYIPSKRYGRMR